MSETANPKLIAANFFHLAANFRSISAVDANAVQRARVRAQYANMSRMKMTPGSASLRKYCCSSCSRKLIFVLNLTFTMWGQLVCAVTN